MRIVRRRCIRHQFLKLRRSRYRRHQKMIFAYENVFRILIGMKSRKFMMELICGLFMISNIYIYMNRP